MDNGGVSTPQLFSSRGGDYEQRHYVRPIITLPTDVQIKMDANHDGSSKDKAFILQ